MQLQALVIADYVLLYNYYWKKNNEKEYENNEKIELKKLSHSFFLSVIANIYSKFLNKKYLPGYFITTVIPRFKESPFNEDLDITKRIFQPR